VFVNSIDAVRRIVPLLISLRLPAIALHSQLIQKQRLQSLERFKASPKSILVATDIAARGLDISNVQHVVHYHLPLATDTYIHRSGRTARGVEEGVSLLLCSPEEQKPLRQMLIKLDKRKFLNKMLDAFPIDRIQVARLKNRVDLAQKIVKASREVQRKGYEEKWLAEAADDLGVDTDEIEQVINSKGYKSAILDVSDFRKYGKQRTDNVSKIQVQAWKGELEELLSQPLKAGFSARYLTSGSINHADRLLKGDTHEAFVGMDVSSALEDIQTRKTSKVRVK
jgi:ATP-dependent RNA helicase DDX24/MAK5